MTPAPAPVPQGGLLHQLSGKLFARVYDRAMAATEQGGLGERRRALLAGASGRVLEIGAGTGVNLACYGPEVGELVLIEPEAPMASRLRARVASAGRAGVRVLEAPAEALPLPDASVDMAVSTLCLCTVGDPGRALAELRRVLTPGGRLLFIEHVRADDQRAARVQDLVHPVWVRIGHGCHCNRPTLRGIEDAGFTVAELTRAEVPKAPPFVRPLIAGVAISPG